MAESDVKPAEQQITLTIVDTAGVNNPVKLKVKRGTKFEKIFRAYYTSRSIAPDSVKFQYEGEEIQADSSPHDLEMDDGAQIDSMAKQTGGSF